MARGKNKRHPQTFQQRQTQLHQRDAKDRAVVEDIATRFTCSNAVARDFAGQCEERIEDLEFDLACSELARDFWANAPASVAPLVTALQDLYDERQRHLQALNSLRHRLHELTQPDPPHHHLELPNEHYALKVRDRLFPDLTLPARP